MLDLPWYKRWISYIYPITITKQQNDTHSNLKLKYFQGQVQLESEHALYSDGHRYTPFKIAYNYLQKRQALSSVQRFLLLGAGLGSALHRLQTVYQLYPETYLVEYDADILKLSQQYLLTNQKSNVHFVRKEAMDFISESKDQFDLIGIDLFDALKNSYLVTLPKFWEQIKRASHPKSVLVVNTIFLQKKARRDFECLISKDFTFVCLKRIPNYIYILKIK